MENDQQTWEAYKDEELRKASLILSTLGFELDREQPHIGGERYLMQALTTTSGRKLILIGKRIEDQKKVVIKITSDLTGMQEIEHERLCRFVLSKISFAYQAFLIPEEVMFQKNDGCMIFIQEFIPQQSTFLERPVEEQFALVLKAFKAQESAHATTYGHMNVITKTFGSSDARKYLDSFAEFKKNIIQYYPDPHILTPLLEKAEKTLQANANILDQYGDFLTHVDFVPHNFRVAHNSLYLLDSSSLRFGNKYEGWARFLNFMLLYNPRLEQALVEYVRVNRTQEESDSLRLMRIYRLGEIIWYYTKSFLRSSGDLQKLSNARIFFWSEVLDTILKNKTLPPNTLRRYVEIRDSLRSNEEKKRQIGLH